MKKMKTEMEQSSIGVRAIDKNGIVIHIIIIIINERKRSFRKENSSCFSCINDRNISIYEYLCRRERKA